MEISASLQRRRLRSACDLCHASKIRCTGGQPCKRCCNSNLSCTYSYMAKLGKPKGSRNKRTLERLSLAVGDGAMATMKEPTAVPTDGAFQCDWPIALQDEQEKDMPVIVKSSSFTIQPVTAHSDTACTPMLHDLSPNLSMELSNILDLDVPLFFPTHFPAGRKHQTTPGRTFSFSLEDGNLETGSRSRTDLYDDIAARESPLISHMNSGSPDFSHEYYGMSNEDHHIVRRQSQPTILFSNCTCLKTLTTLQCSLKGIEREQGHRSLDAILSMATMIIDCSNRALSCDLCLLDDQILLLILVLLQTVFNWALLNCDKAKSIEAHKPPSTTFGTWSLSEDESTAIKTLLVNRIMAKSWSIINIIHQRIDRISSTEAESRYQTMDSQMLCSMSKRLLDALTEVKRHGKERGILYD
ncbi:hypothetical protein V8C35DRAFT_302636 [Trichoderma chlorosporum]